MVSPHNDSSSDGKSSGSGSREGIGSLSNDSGLGNLDGEFDISSSAPSTISQENRER